MTAKTSAPDNSVTTLEFEKIDSVESGKQIQPVTGQTRKRIEPVNWDRELQWFEENQWVFEKYKGTWVAIKGQKLVAHNDDYQKLQTFCRENSIENPFMQYIPNSEHEWDIGLSNYVVLTHSDKNT
jgi:hypothetical protein